MTEYILPPIVFFFLSLFGAYVLFKVLESSALIEDKSLKTQHSIKLGGAVAGFVVIFWLLSNFYGTLRGTVPIIEHEKWKPQEWTVFGNICKEDATCLKGIDVKYEPPSPLVTIPSSTASTGCFYLSRVKVIPALGWPVFQFFCDGYMIENYRINPKRDTIDRNNKEIKLAQNIELVKIPD